MSEEEIKVDKELEDKFLDALEDWLQCSHCSEFKKDVVMQSNPYDSEIYNDYTLCALCDDCAHELYMDT